jgi:transketolase C-terminal domain/subunit
MRGVFLDKLYKKMETDETIFFLTADMGINLVERFEEKFPDRFLNVGIAEQNLIGVAAGLAESGMRPYVYTISNFLVHRCFEQIRNDVVIHKLPVVLIGTSTGYDNGPLGPTHHMLEDWGVISNLTGIRIFAPYSKQSTENIFDKTYELVGPAYVRIAKGDGIETEYENHIDKESTTVIVTYGSAVKFAQKYASENSLKCILVDELGIGSFETLNEYCKNLTQIIVVEDHFPNTGMYSYVTQWVNSRNLPIKVTSISPTSYSLDVGFEFRDFLEV